MFYKKFDIKKTLSAGLIISTLVPSILPAATMESFPFFLTALFTVGLGFQFNKLC
jgi:FHS family L-fucose permease-like MFS transporter